MTEKMLKIMISLWALQGDSVGEFFPEDVAVRASILGEETNVGSASTTLGDLHRMNLVKRGPVEGAYVLSSKGERMMELARRMFGRIVG